MMKIMRFIIVFLGILLATLLLAACVNQGEYLRMNHLKRSLK